MLRKILLTMLISLSISVPTVFAADKPAEDKSTDVGTTEKTGKDTVGTADTATSNKVEVRDVSQFFDDGFNDMKEELETAKTDGKQGLLIMFEMEECPFCHRMKTTVLNRSDIQNYFKQHFRIVSVDIEGDVDMTDFKGETITQKDFALKEFRVRATPVFQFMGLDGEPMKNGRLTGATEDAAEFMLFGKFIVDKKNEEMPFIKYKHEQGADTKADDAKG